MVDVILSLNPVFQIYSINSIEFDLHTSYTTIIFLETFIEFLLLRLFISEPYFYLKH
jgi:hypothetical protein